MKFLAIRPTRKPIAAFINTLPLDPIFSQMEHIHILTSYHFPLIFRVIYFKEGQRKDYSGITLDVNTANKYKNMK
jgi:hypothetical protein